MLAAVEDSGEAFDEELRVETSMYWVHDLLGSRPPLRRVRVTATGLDIDSDRSTPHEQIMDARLAEKREPPCVVIVDRAERRTTIEVPTPQEGVRLLAALGYRIARENKPIVEKKTRTDLTRYIAGGVLLLVLAFIFSLTTWGAEKVLRFLPAVFGAYTLFAMQYEPKVVIGRDGVSVASFFFPSRTKRFISYRDIVSVTRTSQWWGIVPRHVRVKLELRSEEIFAISVARDRGADVAGARMVSEIKAALATWHSESPTEIVDVLERGGRGTGEWISSLKLLGTSDEVAYRVAPIDREALLAIAEDPANEAHSRAAAAVVLGEKLTSEERARLEASAKSVAEPRLRVVMEHVVEKKEDEDLGAILDDLDPIEKVVR